MNRQLRALCLSSLFALLALVAFTASESGHASDPGVAALREGHAPHTRARSVYLMQHRRAHFLRTDADADGRVSAAEFDAVVHLTSAQETQANLPALEDLDVDADGAASAQEWHARYDAVFGADPIGVGDFAPAASHVQ